MKCEVIYSIISRLQKLLKGNKMRLKILAMTMLAIMMITACETKERVKASENTPAAAPQAQSMSSGHTILAKEVMQGNTYTYILASEGNKEYWIATAKQPIEAGMTLQYDNGLEMTNFTSKEVDKTFDSIWFVSQMRGMSSAIANASSGKSATAPIQNISIEKAVGGVSIAELYSNKAKYEGKTVTVRGQVTKFNAGIMGRNWVHIQDGTKSGEGFDVTITTQAVVNMNDIVVFSGKVALNKDFGAGYKYEVIVEDADLSAQS